MCTKKVTKAFDSIFRTRTTAKLQPRKRHKQLRFQAFLAVKRSLAMSLNYSKYKILKIFFPRFGRHRVIIRKGHVGRRFYIIYSGTVAYTLSEDDCEVFSRPTQYYHLGKGDAFGVRTFGVLTPFSTS